jgi:thymidylate kinase
MESSKKVFIFSIEGLDGCGKTTQAQLVAERLTAEIQSSGLSQKIQVMQVVDNDKENRHIAIEGFVSPSEFISFNPTYLGTHADYHYRMFMRYLAYEGIVNSLDPNALITIIISDRSYVSSAVYQNKTIYEAYSDVRDIWTEIAANNDISVHWSSVFYLESSAQTFADRNGEHRDGYEKDLSNYEAKYKGIASNNLVEYSFPAEQDALVLSEQILASIRLAMSKSLTYNIGAEGIWKLLKI